MSNSPPATEVRAEDVTTTAALEALRPEWERLWARVPRATPFQSPHWLLPWWRHVGQGALATIAIRCAEGGELIALAPLYVHADAPTGRRHLFPIGIATTDYLDLLVLAGREQQAIACLGAHLARRLDGWDVLEWPQLRRGAPLLGLAGSEGRHRRIVPGEPNPMLVLEDAHGGGGLPIPAPMAENLRYCRRRAARAGALAYETADARTLRGFLDALVRLHGRRWSLRGLTGVLDDAGVLAWHREAAALLQGAALLRLHGLRLDGELIAVVYCLGDAAPAHERCCYYYIGGFDPRVRALSPGTLLVGYAIERAIAEGARAFDFLRGDEAYKYRWGAVNQPMCTLQLGECP
jgi:CelD/BcsL family acetyltransferase involved in cellulose biosynthesis